MVALASDLMKERQDERLAEVSEILAIGLLRRWRAQRCSVPRACLSPEDRRFSGRNLLEVPGKAVPDVAVN